MSVNNQIVESIGPARWCLVGSLTAPMQLSQGSHSVKVIRHFDILSSQIRSAMNAKSILPVVEINTPDGKVTLMNAKIVNIVPVPRGTPKHRTPRLHTNELEEFEFVFDKITYSNNIRGKVLDDWSSGG